MSAVTYVRINASECSADDAAATLRKDGYTFIGLPLTADAALTRIISDS
jgi:hypothetical protein